MSGVIYSIHRFDPVFIKSDNRKSMTRSEHGTLNWVSWPTRLDTSGYNALFDEFDPVTATALYGAFAVLVQIAAVAPVVGTLADSRGRPYTINRIVRDAKGPPLELFEKLIEWGLRNGWIESKPFNPDVIPTDSGLRNVTEQNETLRNGTEREARESPPGRSVVFESPEAQETQITNRINEQTEDRPASITLAARSRTLPLLRDLGNQPLTGTGVIMHGSVFADDRIKAHHIVEAPAAFFLKWYLDQLTATRPVLKNGNRGQACFVLAAVYAVRRCTDASLRGTKRIARWIHWVRTGETNQITDADFARAAKEVAAFCDAVPVIAEAFKSAAVAPPKEEYKPPEGESLAARAAKVADVRKRIQSRVSK